jgi:CheY-like chemotaxis protein
VTLVEQILKRRPSVNVVAAMQGTLALELARQHRPDLVLLDLHLPDIAGEEVMRRLANDDSTRHIPVVILSADATDRHRDQLLRSGATDYLTKPISVRRLLEVVDAVLEQTG